MGLPLVTFPTLGWQVIDWIEAMLCHGPGDVQGTDWEIDEEFALFLCWLYRVYPQGHKLAGRRLVQRGILSRPKGRAKSELAGGWVCAEALGPVRCNGFDANGDPVGVPVRYPFIRCLATEEDQAGNTYDNVVYMLQEGRAADEYAIDTGLTRTFIKEPGGGEIVPSTSGDVSKDGGKESASVADETHLYVLPKIRQMYGTVARNTGKRKEAEPLMLDTTTAWQPGERSVAEQAAERYADLDAEEAVHKFGVLYDHRQGDVPKRFNDNRSLKKAIRSGYGPAAEWMDFDRIVRIIRDAEDPEADAYRYWLNRPRAAASHWLEPDVIEAVLGKVELEDGAPITIGFDGAPSDDHTAMIGCTEDARLFPIGIWARPLDFPIDEVWEVPYDEVDEAFRWAAETFNVVRAYADPPWFQELIAKWIADFGEPPVSEWWTHRDSPMAVACGNLKTAIGQAKVTISTDELRTEAGKRDGMPILQWHFVNTRKRKVRLKLEDKAEEAHVIRKERTGSPLKIDGAVAGVLAYEARNDALARGEFAKAKRSKRLVVY